MNLRLNEEDINRYDRANNIGAIRRERKATYDSAIKERENKINNPEFLMNAISVLGRKILQSPDISRLNSFFEFYFGSLEGDTTLYREFNQIRKGTVPLINDGDDGRQFGLVGGWGCGFGNVYVVPDTFYDNDMNMIILVPNNLIFGTDGDSFLVTSDGKVYLTPEGNEQSPRYSKPFYIPGDGFDVSGPEIIPDTELDYSQSNPYPKDTDILDTTEARKMIAKMKELRAKLPSLLDKLEDCVDRISDVGDDEYQIPDSDEFDFLDESKKRKLKEATNPPTNYTLNNYRGIKNKLSKHNKMLMNMAINNYEETGLINYLVDFLDFALAHVPDSDAENLIKFNYGSGDNEEDQEFFDWLEQQDFASKY